VVVVTRARAQAREMIEMLEARGARVIELPTIEMVVLEDQSELDQALRSIARYDAVVIGSKNAADVVFARASALGTTLDVPIACVGAKTLAYVSARTKVRVIAPEEHRAEALVELLARELGATGKRYLFPRAPEGREVIVEELRARGATVDAIAVYRIATAASASAEQIAELERADTFTFLSGETLRAFLDIVPEQKARAMLERAKVAVIGPVAKAKADALGVRVDIVPDTATAEALIAAL